MYFNIYLSIKKLDKFESLPSTYIILLGKALNIYTTAKNSLALRTKRFFYML